MVTVCVGRMREVGYCLWGESERSELIKYDYSQEKVE